MIETAPAWSVILLPTLLVLFALAAAAFDAILETRASGGAGITSAALGPLREVARLMVQQRRVTLAPDQLLTRLGVVTLPVAAILAGLVVPLGVFSAGDLGVGVVWFNAMEVLGWAGVWLAGWGSNAVFSLVGGYRGIIQGLTYELPLMFALTTAALGAGSLRVGTIVSAQATLWFAVWMPVAFVAYLISVLALAFWGPFDAPVGRDIAGGAAAEFAGVDRLLFLGGRWLLLVVAAAFAVPLFLGGGAGPVLPSWIWTLAKTAAVLAFLVWLRRRLPTLRMDRFVGFAWTVLIPVTIAQALAVALVVLAR